MKKQRNISFKFPLHIYPFEILCFFDGDLDYIHKVLAKNKVDLVGSEGVVLDASCDGRVAYCTTPHIVSLFKFLPSKPYHQGLIAHEVTHIACHVANRVGLELSEESEEAYSYLIQYITEKIYEHLNRDD